MCLKCPSTQIPWVPECPGALSAQIPWVPWVPGCLEYPSVLSGLSAQVLWVPECPSTYRVPAECPESVEIGKNFGSFLSE